MAKSSDALAIKSVIDGVDHVAVEMETKWGVGRLRLLVVDDMRERFDRQAALFNEAVFTNDAKAVRRHGEGMRKAWLALEQGRRSAVGDSLKEVTTIDVMRTIDELVELLRQLEMASEQLPEASFEWNEEKEDYEFVRVPPTTKELVAVDEVRDLVDELFRIVRETRVALIGDELRAEKGPETTPLVATMID